MVQLAGLSLLLPESLGAYLREISRIPPANPKPPRTIISQGEVCSQLSRKYPISPPAATAPTKVKGNSMAVASWFEVVCAF
jgi:hypothetical protein